MTAMPNDQPKHLSELADPGTTVMVGVCSDRSSFESRPLTVAEVDGEQLSYLIDDSAPWAEHLGDGDQVHSTISNDRENTYVSLNGSAEISRDPKRIDALWNPFADAYFEGGRANPHIAVLTVRHDRGTYWAGPKGGHLGSVISFLRAKLTDGKETGEHGEVAL